MRKLLLASAATLSALMGMADVAQAQSAVTDGQTAPVPGTVTVRLNGRVRFYAYYAQDRDADNNAAGTGTTGNVGTTAGTAAFGQGASPSSSKLANYGFGTYARLYPGFDGVAANGLKYGASLEIRQDGQSGAGGGAFGSISQQNRARNQLYFRRQWGYLGTDRLGTIRLGQTDGPTSLYMTGSFENFNDGAWNGDVPSLMSGAVQPSWPFFDVGAEYTTMKAVYLSPQFFGFDFGVSYEPSTATGSVNNGCGAGGFEGTNFVNPAGNFTAAAGANNQAVATAGCDRLSSSPYNNESSRRKNTFEGLLRYRGTFGPVGVAATAAYVGSSNVKDNSGFAFTNDPRAIQSLTVNGSTTTRTGTSPNFDGFDMGDFGATVTFAGIQVGGKYQVGRYNGSVGLVPKGLPDGEAWLAGASYTFGPFVVGGSYFDFKSAGDAGNAFFGRQRREIGAAAGGTYTLAPGVSLFASYLWGQRKQNGYDFITGQGVGSGATTNAAGTGFNNKVQSQLFSLGTSFQW